VPGACHKEPCSKCLRQVTAQPQGSNISSLSHADAAASGPIYKISCLSYDNAKVVIHLQTSYKGRKAFLRYVSVAES